MNNLSDATPSSYGTQEYFNIPIIELKTWQLMGRKDSDIPGHYRSMVFHQCEKSTHDIYMNGLSTNLQCNACRELIPDEIQVVWTFMNHDLLGNKQYGA